MKSGFPRGILPCAALTRDGRGASLALCTSHTDVYIAAVARTPVGNLGGALAALTAPQLGAVVIRGALPPMPASLPALP